MKWASKIGLFISGGCLMLGVGSMAAPTLRDSLRFMTVFKREEPPPPITGISPADKDAPHFRVLRLSDDITPNVFQAIAINNNGEILCAIEDRSPYKTPGRFGRAPILRYRTIQTRYLLYKDGQMSPLFVTNDRLGFRPAAFNDNRQILGFKYDPKDYYKFDEPFAPNPSLGGAGGGGVFQSSRLPVLRKSRLILWEKGKFEDLKIPELLVKAGMASRFLPFLDNSPVLMNAQKQILIGLQNLYKYDKGTIRRLGSSGFGNYERLYLNDRGSIIRRADQYRSTPDGNNFYPLLAFYQPNYPAPKLLDFGYLNIAFDLNNRDELLMGKMYITNGDTPRTRFSLWDGTKEHPLFTINGRSPARFNSRGTVIAWRTPETSLDWTSLTSFGATRMRSSIPILWYGHKLYDLQSLISGELEISNIIDLNERNELLVQARVNGKVQTLLLLPVIT